MAAACQLKNLDEKDYVLNIIVVNAEQGWLFLKLLEVKYFWYKFYKIHVDTIQVLSNIDWNW